MLINLKKAFLSSFSYKKMAMVFPVVLLCALLISFFRGVAYGSNPLIVLSAIFLPILLCATILFVLGILLIQMYHFEKSNLSFRYVDLLKDLSSKLLSTSLYFLPIICSFIGGWIFLGLLMLLKALPGVGNLLGAIFSSLSFLLILGFLLLALLSLVVMFFITPTIALTPSKNVKFSKELFLSAKKLIFTNLKSFLVALGIVLAFGLFFSFAAMLSQYVYVVKPSRVWIGIQWFFLLLPFSVLMTPVVIFFFHFSLQSYYDVFQEDKESL